MALFFDRDRVGSDTGTNATADTTNWKIDVPTDNDSFKYSYLRYLYPYDTATDAGFIEYVPKKKMSIIGKGKAYCEYCLKKPCKSNCETKVKEFNV